MIKIACRHLRGGAASLVALVLAQGCATAEPSAMEARASAPVAENAPPPRLITDYPVPDLRLARYAGSLCPQDSLTFSANDGALTIVTSAEQSGVQRCEIHLTVGVPAGYRFRRPIFYASGWAVRDDETVQSTRVSITYAVNETAVTSQHVVPGLPLAASESDSFVLVDTPALTFPACAESDQPSELDLVIDVSVDTPEGAYAQLTALDGELVRGVEWRACNADAAR